MDNSTKGSDQEMENGIEKYTFSAFDKVIKDQTGAVNDFSLQEFSQGQVLDLKDHREKIIVEALKAEEKNFIISPVVKQHRGLAEQEKSERERYINDIVEKRVFKIQEDAFKSGFEEGFKKGHQDVLDETKKAVEEKLTALTAMIERVQATEVDILKAQKSELYKMIRTLTKWVILRELKDDGEYLSRLCERLIIEIGTRDNLFIQINSKDFEAMPEVLEIVQKRIGELKNLRIEVDYDIEEKGIAIESQNGIVRGTLKEQFKNLDKLFETVGLTAEEGPSNIEE